MYLSNNMNTQTQIELWAEFFQLGGIKNLECLEVFTMMFSDDHIPSIADH